MCGPLPMLTELTGMGPQKLAGDFYDYLFTLFSSLMYYAFFFNVLYLIYTNRDLTDLPTMNPL